jgi:hypothetical protein
MTDTRTYREIGVSRDGHVATHAPRAAPLRRRRELHYLAPRRGDGKDRRRYDPSRAQGCGSAQASHWLARRQ